MFWWSIFLFSCNNVISVKSITYNQLIMYLNALGIFITAFNCETHHSTGRLCLHIKFNQSKTCKDNDSEGLHSWAW